MVTDHMEMYRPESPTRDGGTGGYVVTEPKRYKPDILIFYSELPKRKKQPGPSKFQQNGAREALDPDWVITMEQEVKQASQDYAARSRKNLSRVPPLLRRGDSEAYLPQVVSLGPYHYGTECLRQMDHHKWRALSHALDRDKKHKLADYLRALKDIEAEALDCYEGPLPEFKSNEFVKMMLLDGFFVIELLRGADKGFEKLGYFQDDPTFASSGSLIYSVTRDMIKVENQLPLFVLDKILGLQLDEPGQEGGVAKLVTGFFRTLMPKNEPVTNGDGNQPESPDHGRFHCLDVFRDSLLRTRSNKGGGFWFRVANTWAKLVEQMPQSIMTFAKCFEVGQQSERQQLIHFKERKTACFWDIKFKKGTLEIPRLLIQDGTKSLLLNLIAFEQCHPNRGNNITSYAVFMDNLINSEQDVAYLQSCGIIKNWLGSDAEVAKLFNCLGQEVVFDRSQSYLSGLSKDLNRYYGRPWNTWRASLKNKYFNNPWAFISFLAAVVLLLLTLLQTLYGVYGYYNPR